MLFAALLSSIVGFAFSAIVGSALAYFGLDPVSAVRTIVLCSCAIQLYSVWKLRASIRWRPLWLLLLSGALTVPARSAAYPSRRFLLRGWTRPVPDRLRQHRIGSP